MEKYGSTVKDGRCNGRVFVGCAPAHAAVAAAAQKFAEAQDGRAKKLQGGTVCMADGPTIELQLAPGALGHVVT